MNRIILLVLFVLSYCVGSSQAISQRGTTAVTVQDARLFAQYNFRPPVFSDTIQANLQIGLDSCGALIFSRDINSYYLRACSPKRWVAVSSGGSGNAWNVGGNASPSSQNLGTTTSAGLDIITSNSIRARISPNGINRSAAARNKYLMIDTTAKYLYYSDAISNAGLQQVLNNGEQAYNKNIILFDSITPNYGYKGIQLYQNNGYQSGGTEILINSTYNNTGLFLQAGAITPNEVRPKIKFGNNADDIATTFTVAPSTASGLTFNLPHNSPNGTGEDTLATLADVRNASSSTIDTTSLSNRINSKLNIVDTANHWVNSVTSLNDSSIRVIKGTTTTDITIKSVSNSTSSTRLITQVWNNTGATITKGSVIYINGAHSSNLPTIALALASAESTSAYTYGLVITDIGDNSEGQVIQVGKLEGLALPTSTYTDGQTLYLSPTIPGGYSLTKPLAPNHYVAIGTITRAHPVNGSIQVTIRNGFQLDELSDVKIALVPNDSTLLQFSRVDSLWHDVSVTNAIGTKYLKPTDTISLSNRINLKLNIADTSALQRKSIPAYSILANPTSVSANASAQAFRDTSGTYSGTITWTGTTAPSGATNHSYRLTQVGKCVTLHIALVFATNGASLTAVQMTLPAGAPTPVQPTGLTGSIFNMYPVSSQIVNSVNQTILGVASRGYVRNNTGANGYEIYLTFSTAAVGQVGVIAQYWTN